MEPLPSTAAAPVARRPKKPASRWPRRLAVGLPILLVGVLTLLFCLRLWIDHYLRSAEFRRLMDRNVSNALHADARFGIFHWQGSEVFSASLDVAGDPADPVARLAAEQIRAELNLGALWHGVWRVERLSVEKLALSLGDGTASPPPPAKPPPGWLPKRVEIGEASVEDFAVAWIPGPAGVAGRLEGVRLTARPLKEDRAWEVAGRGGKLVQPGFPALSLERFAAKTNTREIFLTQATAQTDDGGQVELSGRQQLEGDKALDLNVQFNGVNVTDFLPEDWRARLHGQAIGNVHLTGSSAGGAGGWRAEGHASLRNARLEALPFLDELAVFTAAARYKQTGLQKASADFDWTPARLNVRNVLVESEGLLRLEGGFTVRGDQIDGRLQVGVAKAAVRWLAGAGARVFNQPERDGYVWTTMQLSGPVNSPREDLTARLAAAAQQEVIDKAQQGAGTVIDTAGSLLDLLRGP